MRMPSFGSDTPLLILESLMMVGFVWLIGCAASQPIEPSPIGKALLGKNKQELVVCAGSPLKESKTAEGIDLLVSELKKIDCFKEVSRGATDTQADGTKKFKLTITTACM